MLLLWEILKLKQHLEICAPFINTNIENTSSFKQFEYKTKLLGDTVARTAPNYNSGILRNATITVPSKYLINFYRSLEIPCINCKVELSGRRTAFYLELVLKMLILILIILFLLSQTQNYTFLSSLQQQKSIKNHQNFLAKDLEDQNIGINIKEKIRIKTRQINIDISSNKTLQEITNSFLVYLNN